MSQGGMFIAAWAYLALWGALIAGGITFWAVDEWSARRAIRKEVEDELGGLRD